MSNDVLIVGGGIGGLTLALTLHRANIPFKVIEAAPEIKPLGVGLNLLPHAMTQLYELGLEDALLKCGIETGEYVFATRNGQFVYREPRGRAAGYSRPQVSIHRADLHYTLLEEVELRCGEDVIRLGTKCVDVWQDDQAAVADICDTVTGEKLESIRAAAVIACDGVHSVARVKLHPKEAVPRYEGTMQYRGTTRWKPFLTGSSMLYFGTQEYGKLIMYPIKNNIDAEGRQLLNWVVEIVRPTEVLLRDWNRETTPREFIDDFAHAQFDWIDIRAILENADRIFEYPMIDQDPLPFWSQGRITLLGDAAHPMMPRGSNGAAQAIIDAVVLADCLKEETDIQKALKAYEEIRLKATGEVVLANRSIAPDAVLHVVEERTGGKPFHNINDVISKEELAEWQDRYKRVAGFSKEQLADGGTAA